MSNITVTILNQGKVYKDIKEQVDFSSSNLNDYVNILRSTQKNVNSILTEVVEQEKSNDTTADENMEDDEDEESDADEIPNSTAKRKLKSRNSKKKPKLDKSV